MQSADTKTNQLNMPEDLNTSNEDTSFMNNSKPSGVVFHFVSTSLPGLLCPAAGFSPAPRCSSCVQEHLPLQVKTKLNFISQHENKDNYFFAAVLDTLIWRPTYSLIAAIGSGLCPILLEFQISLLCTSKNILNQTLICFIYVG